MLRAVLSSEIDVDKVAYLSDDSVMTGVRYGLGLISMRCSARFVRQIPTTSSAASPAWVLRTKGLQPPRVLFLPGTGCSVGDSS